MKHTELHTWTLEYEKELVSPSNYQELMEEIKLFKSSWPTAQVNGDRMGYVSISYSCWRTAEAAAKMFQQNVGRHDWWKEIK